MKTWCSKSTTACIVIALFATCPVAMAVEERPILSDNNDYTSAQHEMVQLESIQVQQAKAFFAVKRLKFLRSDLGFSLSENFEKKATIPTSE